MSLSTLAPEVSAVALVARAMEAAPTSWDAAKHPRVGKGAGLLNPGWFRPLLGKMLDAILDPKARSDPRGPLGKFGGRQLRQAARLRGIKVRKGMPDQELRNALVKDFHSTSMTALRSGVVTRRATTPTRVLPKLDRSGRDEWGMPEHTSGLFADARRDLARGRDRGDVADGLREHADRMDAHAKDLAGHEPEAAADLRMSAKAVRAKADVVEQTGKLPERPNPYRGPGASPAIAKAAKAPASATPAMKHGSPSVWGSPERAALAKDYVKRYVSGESINDIAKSDGRSYGFVHRMLSETGVQLRGRGGPSKSRSAPKVKADTPSPAVAKVAKAKAPRDPASTPARTIGAERTALTKDYAKRYKGGASIGEIASSEGRSYGFVHRLLTESGVQLRPRGGKADAPNKALADAPSPAVAKVAKATRPRLTRDERLTRERDIFDEFQDGATVEQIAADRGMRAGDVRRILRDAGVESMPAPEPAKAKPVGPNSVADRVERLGSNDGAIRAELEPLTVPQLRQVATSLNVSPAHGRSGWPTKKADLVDHIASEMAGHARRQGIGPVDPAELDRPGAHDMPGGPFGARHEERARYLAEPWAAPKKATPAKSSAKTASKPPKGRQALPERDHAQRTEAARQMGMSPHEAADWARNSDETVPQLRRRLVDEVRQLREDAVRRHKADVTSRYLSGSSIDDIARQTGETPAKVRRIVRDAGILRPTPGQGPLVISDVANEVRGKSGIDDIAALLDGDPRLTPPKLRQLADELGITIPAEAKTKPAITLFIASRMERSPGGRLSRATPEMPASKGPASKPPVRAPRSLDEYARGGATDPAGLREQDHRAIAALTYNRVAHVDELLTKNASDKAIERAITSGTKGAPGVNQAITPEQADWLMESWRTGGRERLRTALRELGTAHGVHLTQSAGAVEPFDTNRHDMIGPHVPAGTPVTIVRPGAMYRPESGVDRLLARADVQAADGPKATPVDAVKTIRHLETLSSREEVLEALAPFKTKAALVALAKALHVPGATKLTTDQLRADIVEGTVGRRLDSVAIRGFDGPRP